MCYYARRVPPEMYSARSLKNPCSIRSHYLPLLPRNSMHQIQRPHDPNTHLNSHTSTIQLPVDRRQNKTGPTPARGSTGPIHQAPILNSGRPIAVDDSSLATVIGHLHHTRNRLNTIVQVLRRNHSYHRIIPRVTTISGTLSGTNFTIITDDLHRYIARPSTDNDTSLTSLRGLFLTLT